MYKYSVFFLKGYIGVLCIFKVGLFLELGILSIYTSWSNKNITIQNDYKALARSTHSDSFSVLTLFFWAVLFVLLREIKDIMLYLHWLHTGSEGKSCGTAVC